MASVLPASPALPLVPTIPATAPFSAEQRAWLNGYLAGLFSRAPVDPQVAARATTAAAAPTLAPLTILFGSQTGTCEGLAKRAAKEAGKRGFAALVLDLAQVDLARLAGETNVLLIASTFGDGEPPDNARALHRALTTAPGDSRPLGRMRFSVCALGDSNYTQFCQCGKEFDHLLEKHGAVRIAPRADCDLDQDGRFVAWLDAALGALAATEPTAPRVGTAGSGPVAAAPATEPASGFSRTRPYSARVRTSRTLNAEGSAKQVHHVELELGDSGLSYAAGDALGVFPRHCPTLVNEVLAALHCDGEEAVPAPDGSITSLRHALSELYDLGRPTPELLGLFGGGAGGLAVQTHQVIDVLLARADVTLEPAMFVRALKRLQPRLYSISSSPLAHPGEVHLTVGAVRYEAGERLRLGVCSTFLADRVVPGETRVGIYLHSNPNFRPPASPDAPMIMIGPGTGIAPFRAFLQERRAAGARGRNWLFFGDQRSATDFLYREEMLGLHVDGFLTRLDLAWSRDQPEKVYVQTRMAQQAKELFARLEAGAHVYVCGDASRMAKDVDAALHTVVEQAGGRTPEQAAAYIESLKAVKRYCRDVY